MGSRHDRRPVVFGFLTGVAALTTASAAFACTSYWGKVVIADTVNGVTQTRSVDGSGGLHGYCPLTPNVDPFGVAEVIQPNQPIDLEGNFTVSIGATTTCSAVGAGENSLAGVSGFSGTYDIRWLDTTLTPVTGATVSDPSGGLIKPNCMNNTYGTPTVIGNLSPNASGADSTTVAVPAGFSVGTVQICVVKAAQVGNLSGYSAPMIELAVI